MHGGKRLGAGRKPGETTKAKRDLMAMAREYAEPALRTLVEIAAKGKSESARASAAVAILDRGYGKPPQLNTASAEQFRRATEMTDDELASIAAGSGSDAPPKTNGSTLTH